MYKRILIWTPYFGNYLPWKKVFRRHLNKECPENRCVIFNNRKKYLGADAILFNANDLTKKQYALFEQRATYPKRRLRHQVYVFFSMEPPTNMEHIQLSHFSNYFNWTMSYRQDSDIVVPYGTINSRRPNETFDSFNFEHTRERDKKKFAVWMVSHCPTASRREAFVKKLQKYVSVDVYGTCGKLKCGTRTILPNLDPNMKDPCEPLITNYTFYLALENALCKDYVTEKLYRSLALGVIPVVMGSPSYSLLAPPHSYIDMKDFDTVEDLANHMKKVAQDANLYKEYFKWKDDFTVQIGHPYKPFTCELCKKLHEMDQNMVYKSYKDIKKWYVTDAKCYSWKEK